VLRRGGWLYNLWKDAHHPRGLWRRTTLEAYRKPHPPWENLLDLDRLAREENQDWLLNGTQALPGGPRTMLSLSRGGSDAVTLREFDTDAKAFVADGFVLPEAKGSAEWFDADTLLLSSAYGAGMATTSGYARTIRRWRRGHDVDTAPVVFEAAGADSMGVYANVDRTGAMPRVWFIERPDFFNQIIWLGDEAGARQKLELPTDAWMEAHRDWLVVKLRHAWTVGGHAFAPDVVLGISLSAFLNGDRAFTVVFEPGPRRALQGFFWAAGNLVLSILDELRPVFEVCTPSEQGWTRARLPGLPEIGVVDIQRFDTDESESNGDLRANIQDPLTPPSLMLIEGIGSPTLLKQAPRTFSATGLAITQHEAISIDGERIPYVQTGPAAETGDAPVYMTAYGGFGLAVRPYYDSALGRLWLERGGTCVQANIRGGGEFGTRWHDAGRYAGKRLTHDDFAAVAADLVKRGVTRADRIAADGGSNGGILISNMLVRYPERFGALLCRIPLIDMRRYSKLLAGASWIAEYGDPDKPEEWAWLQTYSAYHLAKPGQTYPPILFATTRRDDRVHPGHARKMAAKLQAMGYEAYFYEPAAGGHGYGKDNKERAAFIVLGYSFLKNKIGWADNGA
ncbi:MAG TPA: prolyl oligopeptidase family serine peptidase, partial [Bradyrhizobium sp.]|nr:prolyl oligopeptidase family serine peptidase [Bradyrhizobium sp.]